MTLFETYQKQLENKVFQEDPHQSKAVMILQKLADTLTLEVTRKKHFWNPDKLIPGVYLWGNVGVGKTTLMDLFFESLPFAGKKRWHFHRFMQLIHQALKMHEGEKNPLKVIAKDFAKLAKVICLDEFLVNDIADAMVLANLLKALFDENITLVTTANCEPDVLYRNGLQRQRFLPAITLIKQYSEIINLPTMIDYRLSTHIEKTRYFYPLQIDTEQKMWVLFQTSSETNIRKNTLAYIQNRPISAKAISDSAIWFEFSNLCHVPRSQLDYLEIAETYPIVFLSGIQKITAQDSNTARLFINLIDVLYDRHIKLIISAEIPVQEIYTEGRLIYEFRRTKSRLLEMQSEEYWQKK